ncbi:hypothetical protein C8R41DRAFT_856741 [Lentinula lateritia]|uniref:Uncharacterized protein n=1 Tax=Lentinula lateritia TaxID=40482 RepID=A0ABQ8UZ40_9AGAR|nr:hypothetical protein C8R41DRAFT_856741 [Lentinula lateritia]
MYYIVIFWTTSVKEVMGGLHTLVIQGKVFYPAWVVARGHLLHSTSLVSKVPYRRRKN